MMIDKSRAMKWYVLGIFWLFSIMAWGQSPQYNKRMLGANELYKLSYHKDTLLKAINNLYLLEKKENAPGKYQPQRIELVRQYLLLFKQIQNQYEFVYYSTSSIIQILGKPDKSYYDDDYLVYEYNSIKNKFVSIKNIHYHLVFDNDELVFITQRTD
jgi:hypothetical protein